MKLIDVWNAASATQGKSIWSTLASLKKPPKVSYRLLKYGAKLSREFDVIEKQRIKLLYEVSGAKEGEQVIIGPGTPEFAKFVADFNEFLSGESDLELVGLDMDTLIEALDNEKGNVLSEQDLAALEPFFQVKPDEKQAE